MQTNVLVVAHAKGGTLKTETAAGLAAQFAALGWSVLAIDLDPQPGNLTARLGALPAKTIGDVLGGATAPTATIRSAAVPVDVAGGAVIQLVGANAALANVEKALQAVQPHTCAIAFYNALDAARAYLPDLVVIDTPPASGLLTASALVAAGRFNGSVVIPSRPEDASIEGIRVIQNAIHQLAGLGSAAKIAGTIATAVESGTVAHRDGLARLQALPLPFLGCVPKAAGQDQAARNRDAYAQIAGALVGVLGLNGQEEGQGVRHA